MNSKLNDILSDLDYAENTTLRSLSLEEQIVVGFWWPSLLRRVYDINRNPEDDDKFYSVMPLSFETQIIARNLLIRVWNGCLDSKIPSFNCPYAADINIIMSNNGQFKIVEQNKIYNGKYTQDIISAICGENDGTEALAYEVDFDFDGNLLSANIRGGELYTEIFLGKMRADVYEMDRQPLHNLRELTYAEFCNKIDNIIHSVFSRFCNPGRYNLHI